MKVVFTIILISSFNLLAAQNNCVRKTKFGSARICLPKIDGYHESYNDPIVKELADKMEVAENMVLGFYFNDSIFSKRDSLAYLNYDDYFKVYATKRLKDLKAIPKVLGEIKKMITQSFIKKEWNELSKEIDDLGWNMKVNEPVLIEDYSINKQSISYILIAKYYVEGREPYVMAMALNAFIQSERLIWMGYYLNYENIETIKRLKNNSNRILEKLVR